MTDKQLDFSHMRDQLRRIAGGPGQLFSLGADNAMLQLVSRGGPRVLESQVLPCWHVCALLVCCPPEARLGLPRLQFP